MTPTDINLNQASRVLAITWPDGVSHQFSCEFLRVHSPSAEVRGHGIGQEVLQVGKEAVNITAIDPVGHYAIKITYDDGHDSGLYDWGYLRDLGDKQDQYWEKYLSRCAEANVTRNPTD